MEDGSRTFALSEIMIASEWQSIDLSGSARAGVTGRGDRTIFVRRAVNHPRRRGVLHVRLGESGTPSLTPSPGAHLPRNHPKHQVVPGKHR